MPYLYDPRNEPKELPPPKHECPWPVAPAEDSIWKCSECEKIWWYGVTALDDALIWAELRWHRLRWYHWRLKGKLPGHKGIWERFLEYMEGHS
ncbi:hypothetical protein SEA_KEELAN_79 [Gordonia phage Keelan]|nr:hypothetical protein SEA_KEELAN_79 [Gordonia phage Keelan]